MLQLVNRNFAIGEQVKVVDTDSKYIMNVGVVVASRVKDGEAQYLVWYLNGEDKQAIFTNKQLRHLSRPFCKTMDIATKCTTAEDFEEKDNRENTEEETPAEEEQSGTVVTPAGPTEEDNF